MFSIYTPTNNPKWLREAYSSLLAQTYDNWEWVLIPNGPDKETIIDNILEFAEDDKRVRVIVYPDIQSAGIGDLKHFACSRCKGDVFVELDHDDRLMPNCLSELDKAVTNDMMFLYSDWSGKNENGEFEKYSEQYGWESYDHIEGGDYYSVLKAFEPSARALCEIYYAPNHVRAWTRKAYEITDGYNRTLTVGDDHELICRTYLARVEFKHIAKPLYMYRMHDGNTVKTLNTQIQEQQAKNRDKYFYDLILEECRRKSLKVGKLGEVDYLPYSENDNLSYVTLKNSSYKLPYKDNSIGLMKAFDFLQLVPQSEVVKFVEELYRVLTPGGWLLTATPSTDGRGAYQDFRHSSFWNQNSWFYWTHPDYLKHYYPSTIKDAPKFQTVRSWTSFPTTWHKENDIPYAYTELVALKPGCRIPGLNNFCDLNIKQ